MTKKAKSNYFDVEQEQAVIMFLEAKTFAERNDIYNKYLRKSIHKMIEGCIRTYKLYERNTTFEMLHTETLSFLMFKFEKFDPARKFKAYSYYNTICKNYILQRLKSLEVKKKKILHYEDIATELEEDPDRVYEMDADEVHMSDVFDTFVEKLNEEMATASLTENERKVGDSLLLLFKNWDSILTDNMGNNKFNKNLVLFYLREMTGLPTKDVRQGLRHFKSVYTLTKKGLLEDKE